MSDIGELTLQAFKNIRTHMIAFGVVFGLNTKEFLSPLWETGNVAASWANWLTKGVPEIPGLLVMLSILYVIGILWEVAKQSQEGGYSDREDGYRVLRDD